MLLYSELADWWPLLSPPEHYVEEVELFEQLLAEAGAGPRLLELGCGGGSNAYHLKRNRTLTLTDISPEMLEVSRRINPECEHLAGDMRTLRLGRTFDVVFIHDAICYLTEGADVRAAIETAAVHLRPGGVALLAPDHVRETFEPATDHGGEDAPDGRGLRYLEWSWDPDPNDTVFNYDFAFLLREADGTVTSRLDRHLHGLFSREEWLAWMDAAGFDARAIHDQWNRDLFFGVRRQ